MSLKSIFRRAQPKDAAQEVYALALERSRDPLFYRDLGVPDTVDGRFEMLALHAFLVLRRLKGVPSMEAFSQTLFDVMFEDMDMTLREMGAGDMGVGKRVKAMVKAFYGRIAAYDAGLAAPDDAALHDALVRNLYRTAAPTDTQIRGMAAYVRGAADRLDAVAADRIAAADFAFGVPA